MIELKLLFSFVFRRSVVWAGCTSITKTDFFSLIVHTQFYWSAVVQKEKLVVVNVLQCRPFAIYDIV